MLAKENINPKRGRPKSEWYQNDSCHICKKSLRIMNGTQFMRCDICQNSSIEFIQFDCAIMQCLLVAESPYSTYGSPLGLVMLLSFSSKPLSASRNASCHLPSIGPNM